MATRLADGMSALNEELTERKHVRGIKAREAISEHMKRSATGNVIVSILRPRNMRERRIKSTK